MDRREFLSTLGLALAGLAVPGVALAEAECSPFNRWGVRSCTAGLPSWRAGSIAATQQNSQWCWAACVQMVLKHYRFEISQKDIVRQVFGAEVNAPADVQTMISALNRVYTNAAGEHFTLVSGMANLNVAASDLVLGQPLIVGTLRHAMVLSAISYDQDVHGRFVVTSAVVRDPWPTSGGRRNLSAKEWASIDFLAFVRSPTQIIW